MLRVHWLNCVSSNLKFATAVSEDILNEFGLYCGEGREGEGRERKGFSLYKPTARVDVADTAFSCSLFSDKVDNTDGLNQLQMDAFGCIVQGSFLTYIILSRPSQS